MEKITCKKGHLYDPEKHSSCPYCGIDIDDFVINIPTHSANYSHSKNEAEKYGKTIPMTGYLEESKKEEVIEPVVAWVIIMSGQKRGMDYRIVSGRNKLGREITNDICISHDNSISAQEHANIIYDPNSKTFYIALGSGRGLAYLNGHLVMAEEVLKANDKIRIGSTEMLFVPLCNSEFNWE